MKTEKQDEALARIDARQALTSDGLTPLKIEQIIMDGAHIYRLKEFGTNAGKSEVIPDYNDRNHLFRLVEGLNPEELSAFSEYLCEIADGSSIIYDLGVVLKASTGEIKEALLKAVGLWVSE